MKKGLSLPISTIVILSISVLVLIVIVGMFMSGSAGFENSQKVANAYKDACNELVDQGCNPEYTTNINLVGITPGDIGISDTSKTANLYNYCVYKLKIRGNISTDYYYGFDPNCNSDCQNEIKKRCAERCGCSYVN